MKMQKFRFKIENIIYDAYDVNITWSRRNDINPSIYRHSLNGSLKIWLRSI